METSQNKTLANFPVGSRLLVKSKKDWRTAVITKIVENTVTISVASPTGYSYRIRRNIETEVLIENKMPILENNSEDWRENFVRYDLRW